MRPKKIPKRKQHNPNADDLRVLGRRIILQDKKRLKDKVRQEILEDMVEQDIIT